MCPVTDAATGETRDVDLLQELILTNGLIDSDWFTIDPKKRLRTWLLPERRLALRQWEAGDIVEAMLASVRLSTYGHISQRGLRVC